MTDSEIEELIDDIEKRCNDAIDKLIKIRNACPNGQKYKYRYVINKMQVIVGACHRVQDKVLDKE